MIPAGRRAPKRRFQGLDYYAYDVGSHSYKKVRHETPSLSIVRIKPPKPLDTLVDTIVQQMYMRMIRAVLDIRGSISNLWRQLGRHNPYPYSIAVLDESHYLPLFGRIDKLMDNYTKEMFEIMTSQS